jgi:sulfate/thiosulfate transport system permease protein
MAAGGTFLFKRPSVIPGFGLALGFTLTYLGLIVLIPLAALIVRSSSTGSAEFLRIALDPRTISALRISFGSAAIAALINAVFGLLLAWVLVRYRFPGRRLVDAMIDLPFALPTAVAGIALSTLYAPQEWLGPYLELIGLKVAFAPLGIVVALVFVGLPFVVRTVQPVLADLDRELEEAAATLGASRLQITLRVILPQLLPAVLTGFALALARAIGEYGSVIFIAGNIPFVSEIAPLLIVIRLSEFRYADATAIAVVMLLASFVIIFAVNRLQRWAQTRIPAH